jgi:hypothetical protein
MKYLQFLPTCFGLMDHHQGNFTKNTGLLSRIIHISPVYGVLLITVKSNVCVYRDYDFKIRVLSPVCMSMMVLRMRERACMWVPGRVGMCM